MLLPRFTLRSGLFWLTAAAVGSIILREASQGEPWAIGMVTALASVMVLLVLHGLLFGAALLGIAGAFAVEGYNVAGGAIEAKGLGLGGAVTINLTAILSLFGTLIFAGVTTRRGKILIWLMILLLLFLTLFEIGHTGN